MRAGSEKFSMRAISRSDQRLATPRNRPDRGRGLGALRVPDCHARQALSTTRPVRRGNGERGGARPDFSIGPRWLRAMKGARGPVAGMRQPVVSRW